MDKSEINKKLELFFVRHGETIENRQKITMGHSHGTLTKRGLNDAAKLGHKLKQYKFTIAYTSDLGRAQNTAKIILSKFNTQLFLKTSIDLRETNFGILEGQRWNKKTSVILKGNLMTKKAPGGESLNQVKKRVRKFLKKIYRKYKFGRILIVCHSGIIKLALSEIIGLNTYYVFKSIDIPTTSVCYINLKPHKITWRLIYK